jgi:hypothetical protein
VGRRWRAASDQQRRTPACLEGRPSQPKTSPKQVPAAEPERICELRLRTGWSPRRLAAHADLSRPHSTVHRVLRRGGCSRRARPERPAVVRYEWPCLGNVLHTATVTAVTGRALDWFLERAWWPSA